MQHLYPMMSLYLFIIIDHRWRLKGGVVEIYSHNSFSLPEAIFGEWQRKISTEI